MSPRASKRALANQESEAYSQRMSKLGRSLLLLVATVLSFASIALLAADQLYRPESFTIDQLKIKGKFRHLEPSQIETVVDPDAVGNFFSVELSEIKQRIEDLPWVHRAEVRREWPDTLSVEVNEHRPVMRWKKDQWVNSYGEVVRLPGPVDLNNPIVVSGKEKDANLILQQAYRWKKKLESKGLSVKAVSLSDSHAWSLKLSYPLNDYDFEVLLGREEIEQRLARFLFLFDEQFKQANKKLKRVDARYPNGLAIRSEPLSTVEAVVMKESEGAPL